MANTKVEVYNAAMALFTANATVTPSQLVAALGPVSMAMAPASKQAWALKKLGFDIQANKDGREVVSYTMLSAPAAAPVAKPVKAAKSAKTAAATTTTKTVKAPKASATATATAAAAKPSRKATAAARKSPTVKYGPANKTGRSEFADGRNTDVSVITEGTEVADVNELDDRSDLPEYLR